MDLEKYLSGWAKKTGADKSPAAVSYFSGMELCSDRIGVRKDRTGLGTGFIR